ncbi:MAG: BLUF domain-containing protein [Chloroflexota bacterium]
MEDKIFKIMYVSSADHTMSDDELMDLLTTSKKNNQARNISGLLLYFDGNFIQLLEGDRDEVQALYAKIAKDRRHSGVIKLIEKFADKREFPEWSMGFRKLDEQTIDPSIAGFLDLVQDSETIKSMLEGVSRRTLLFLDTFKDTSGISKTL